MAHVLAGWFAVMTVSTCDRDSDVRADTMLPASNVEVPFCYVHGGVRRWPVTTRPLPEGCERSLTLHAADRAPATGTDRAELPGLLIELADNGYLTVQSNSESTALDYELAITLKYDGAIESQRLALRPAPPMRPISYYADFGDDLIRLFHDPTTGRFHPLTKSAFDQYFRRLQAHGVRRLIIWQSPFPYLAHPEAYDPDDWRRYEAQAKAILASPELDAILDARTGFVTWRWLRMLLALRISPDFGDLLTRSAADHGIQLAASYRPFEPALTKYYAVPAFAADGQHLWDFLPLASPAVNYHADQVGFAHYREVLKAMGQPDAGRIDTIEITGAADAAGFRERYTAMGDNLRIVASRFPPLQPNSLVLVRGDDEVFRLRRFAEIAAASEAKQQPLDGWRITLDPNGTLRISGLNVPDDCRYLVLSNPGAAPSLDMDAADPIVARSRVGNRLGRISLHWAGRANDPAAQDTLVAGIPANGEYHALFQATEASLARYGGAGRLRLGDVSLVIDLGDPWSVEMVDFGQPAARRYAVNELRAILRHPPFDEVFINTRSHTQLAGWLADGADGIRPIAAYRAAGGNYTHLGSDLAYAPRAAADDSELRGLAADPAAIERITCFQHGEWDGACQSADNPFPWRWSRNRHVAAGLRSLILEIEAEFPETRVRVVLPQREIVDERVRAALARLARPEGGVYGGDYYRHIVGSLNHILAIGEGMALVDLAGTKAEPVFLGIRYLPDTGPFDLFVNEAISDLADNHGSSFHGPRSFFYEAQETLRATDAETARLQREDRIRRLLAHREDIREVILYEAADWLYALPLSDPDHCGHGYLDR